MLRRYNIRYAWEHIHVGQAEAPATNLDQPSRFQFAQVARGRLSGGAEVFGQPRLTGEATAILPGIGEQQGIGEFGAMADNRRPQTEDGIGHLGKASRQYRVLDDNRVALVLVRHAREYTPRPAGAATREGEST
jgi:hypothetical protein